MQSNFSDPQTPGGLASPAGDSAVSEALLVFPPLVFSNWGHYYPSTAVLAAYLLERGLPVVQRDLNAEVLELALAPERLLAAGQGCLSDSPLSFSASAARLLLRWRTSLFDAEGRQKAAPSVIARELLDTFMEGYKLDVPLKALVDEAFWRTPLALAYEDLFEATGVAQALSPRLRVVGISIAMGPQLGPALIFARWLARKREGLCVVLGGPVCSLMSRETLGRLLKSCPFVSAVVRGDGEVPLEQICRQAAAGRWAPEEIPSLSWAKGGTVEHTQSASGRSLESLPFAEYAPEIVARLSDPALAVTQARGCYWGECAYCDYVELYEGSPKYRSRGAERLVDEIVWQSERHGARRFNLITEALPPAFARRFCERLLARGVDVRWASFGMVDRGFTEEVMRLMVAAGCERLTIGLETVNDRVLRLVRKKSSREDCLWFLRAARTAGLPLCLALIADLPTTTYEDALESLATVLEHCDESVDLRFQSFEATCSSDVGRNLEAFSLEVGEADGSGQSEYAENHLPVIDRAMTPGQRREVNRRYAAAVQAVKGRAFAEEGGLAREGAPLTRARLVREYLDIVDAGDSLHVFHCGTRVRRRLGESWKQVILPLMSGAEVTAESLGQLVGEEQGRRAFATLLEWKMLAPASEAT